MRDGGGRWNGWRSIARRRARPRPDRPRRRRARRAAALALAGAAAYAGVLYFFPQPPRFRPQPAPSALPEGPVLVIAPHNDDEVLGAGGLLRRAVQTGHPVRVVLMTNGDGFTVAVDRRFGRLVPAPDDYRRLGETRQRESLAALARLGVPASAVTFLGYPDGGVSRLWQTYWDDRHPYHSRFTGTDRSPYPNSYRPSAPYAGEALAQDLIRILGEFRPALILLPHPGDAHPDHWATYNFVTYAEEVWRQRNAPWAEAVERWAYLVHRGDWPAPKGLHPEAALSPPAPMLHQAADWFAFPLAAEETAAKAAAIEEYQTQTAIMRRYLVSFARENELFARAPTTEAAWVAPRLRGEPRWPDWDAGLAWTAEPTGDTILRDAEGAADIAGVSVARDADELFIAAQMRRPVSGAVRYTLRARAIGAEETAAPAVSVRLRPGRPAVVESTAGGVAARATSAGRHVMAAIRLADLEHPSAVMVGVETAFAGATVDRSAWIVVRLPTDRPPRRFTGSTPW